MFVRLLRESFTRNPRRKLLTGIALVLGMTVATATFTVAVDVGDQLAREFRSLGANLLITPQADTLPVEIGGVDYRPVDQGAYLPVSDLPKLKEIFWRHNILGFTPFLDVPVTGAIAHNAGPPQNFPAMLVGTWYSHAVPLADGTTFTTGASFTHPWWKISGQWFADGSKNCVVGALLAKTEEISIGDVLNLSASGRASASTVTGIITTGDAEDNAIVCPLVVAQDLAAKPDEFRQVLVSALTKPADALAIKDPNSMTPTEFDRWYCSPYISSIGHQIQQVLPGTQVQTIRRVAETEGRILSRVSLLLWIVTIAALIAVALAVGATSATTAIERRAEVALMKALGATNFLVSGLFVSEQLLLAIVGGGIGFLFGAGLARQLGETVFGVATSPRLVVLPVILIAAALVALIGSWIPLHRAANVSPAPILRGE
ncbi:MAG TPA: ABC transporter permease [Candidatus Acidoferrales bacterium]|nr:ABC transporter permease [Candidatus Acidoferrales bacterium]